MGCCSGSATGAVQKPDSQVSSQKIKDLAIATIMARNKKHCQFDTTGIDVEDIIQRDIKQLQEGLKSGKFTSVQLVNVFGSRCQTIGRELCLSTEENFEEALQLAKEKDQEREQAKVDGKTLSPMHGIPFSVKDFINMKGFLSTVGCAFMNDDKYRANKDSVMVQLYRKAGGIPLVRGNCSQSAMTQTTSNMTWGQARNPLDQTRRCGGSSGGDAGLVASRCVPMGLGTDIGGSVRIPCASCGLYGLRPTGKRPSMVGMIPAGNLRFNMPGHMVQVIGPLTTSVDDLMINADIMFDPKIHMYEPLKTPCPLNQDRIDYIMNPANFKDIKIGFLDPVCVPDPISDSVSRALKIAKDAYTKLGFDVVTVNMEERWFKGAMKYMTAMVCDEQMEGANKVMEQEGEVWHECAAMMGFFKKMYADSSHEKRENLMKEMYEYMDDFSQYWQDLGITALVSTTHGHAAWKIGPGDSNNHANHMMIWSILGYPNGTMPVTTVTKEEETFVGDEKSKKLVEQCKGSEGLPISLNIIGYSFQDEDVLGLMKVLEGEVGYTPNRNPKIDLDFGKHLWNEKTGYTQNYP